jgi:maleate isomerase
MSASQASAAEDNQHVVQRAHVGVIVPAVNRTCETQFHNHAPKTLGVHTMRARIAGKWARPVEELKPEIELATQMLAECAPDLMVYNCTSSSMKEGPEGEKRILGIMEETAGIPAISTSAAVGEAFKHFGIKSVIVVTPYQNNNDILFYLDKIGIKIAGDVALALDTSKYGAVTPQEWVDIAMKHDSKDADAIFLSCAATTQIDAVAPLEAASGKPVVNSNQAVLWASLERLRGKLGVFDPPATGGLMRTLGQ